jgi:hypothetical protein
MSFLAFMLALITMGLGQCFFKGTGLRFGGRFTRPSRTKGHECNQKVTLVVRAAQSRFIISIAWSLSSVFIF